MRKIVFLMLFICLFFPLINIHSQGDYQALEANSISKVVVFPFINLSNTTQLQYEQLQKAIPLMIAGEYSNCIKLEFMPPKRADNYAPLFKYDKKLSLKEYKEHADNLRVDIIIHGIYSIVNNELSFKTWIYFKKANTTIQIDESANIQTHFYQVQKALIEKVGNVLGLKLDINQLKSSCGGFYNSLILLIDASGSMKDDSKLDYAKKFANEILDRLNPNTEAAILAFAGNDCHPDPLAVIHPFSNNFQAIKMSQKNIVADGGTPLSSAMEKAIDYLEANHRGKKGHIILLSDGQDDCRKIDEALEIVNKAVYTCRT